MWLKARSGTITSRTQALSPWPVSPRHGNKTKIRIKTTHSCNAGQSIVLFGLHLDNDKVSAQSFSIHYLMAACISTSLFDSDACVTMKTSISFKVDIIQIYNTCDCSSDCVNTANHSLQ